MLIISRQAGDQQTGKHIQADTQTDRPGHGSVTRTNSQARTRIDRQTDKQMEADRLITDHDEERERETDRKAGGYRQADEESD